MRKIRVTAIALVSVLLAPAMAAGAEKPVSWTGFYGGVSAGYAWGGSQADPSGKNTYCLTAVTTCEPHGFAGFATINTAAGQAIPPEVDTRGRGGMFGVTLGYNRQFDAWVAGFETDISWTRIEQTETRTGAIAIAPGGALVADATLGTRLSNFGTARVRLGFVPFDSWLVYATGGLAYGRVSSEIGVTEQITPACGSSRLGCTYTSAMSTQSATRVGWTLGGGLEFALSGPWSMKAEYLYYDLGHGSHSFGPLTITGPCGGFGGPPPCLYSSTAVTATESDFTGSVIRVGLNYKLGQ